MCWTNHITPQLYQKMRIETKFYYFIRRLHRVYVMAEHNLLIFQVNDICGEVLFRFLPLTFTLI